MRLHTREHETVEQPKGAGAPAPAAARRSIPAGEPALHTRLEHVVTKLEREFPGCEAAMVRQMVESVSGQLLADAKCMEFVPVLTERHVRAMLREQAAR